MSADRERGRRYTKDDDSDDDDDYPVPHIECWIPGENIDITVLAWYLKEFIDDTATIRMSASPADRNKTGFRIGASNTLSTNALRDLILDSRDWNRERETREFKRNPYSYGESDTSARRKRNGPTPNNVNPRPKRRRQPAAGGNARGEASKGQGQGQTTSTNQSQAQQPPQAQGQGRHTAERDNRPSQIPRPRSRSRSGSPPDQPHPNSYSGLGRKFEDLSVRDEPAQANKSARMGGDRHAKTEDTKSDPKRTDQQKTGVFWSDGKLNRY